MVKQSPQSIASLEWPVESWEKSRKLPMTDEIILNAKGLSSGKSRLKITDIIQVKREDDKVRFMGRTLCFNLNIRQGHNRDDMRRLEEFVEAVEEQRMQLGGGVSSSAAYAPVNKLDKATPQRPLARIRKAVPALSNLGAFNSSHPAAEPSSSSTFRSPPATSHHTKSANTATSEGIAPRLRQSLAAAEHDESVSRLSGALGSTSSPLSVAGKTASKAPVTELERSRSSPKRPRVPSPDRTPQAGSRTPSHMSVGRYAARSVGRKSCPMRALNGAIYPRQSAPPSFRGDGMVCTSWSNSSNQTSGLSRGGLVVGSRSMVGSRVLSSSSSTLGDGKFEGIKNLGNTCYMNAVVECLAGLPSLADDLLSSVWFTQTADDLKRLTASASELSTSTPVISGVYAALLRILLELKKTKHGVIDPTSFRKTMATHCKAYGSGVQQDAHEFLGDLLNTLQEELFPYARRVASAQLANSSASALSRNIGKPTTEQLGMGPGDKGQTSIRSFFRSSRVPSEAETIKGEQDATVSEAEAAILEQVLPVTRHFHAEVLKTLTCARKECGYSRSRVEAFTDFSVELLQDDGGKGKDRLKPLHVLNLMKQFFKEQMLELACEKCGHDRVRVLQCFNKLPRILVVHLKRFKLNGTTNIKLTTEVEAPVDLDLSVLCDGNTLNPLVRPLGEPAPAEFSELLGVAKGSKDKPDHDTAASSAADPVKGTKCAMGNAKRRDGSEAAEQEQADMDRWALDDDDIVSSPSPKRKGSPCADHAEGQQKRTPKAAKGMEEGANKGLIGSVEEDRQLQEAIRQSLAEAKIKEKEQALLASIEVPDDDVDAISIASPDLPAPSVDKENMCPNRDAAVPPPSTTTTAMSANMKPSLMSPIDLRLAPVPATLSSSTAGNEQRRPPRDGPLCAKYEIKCVIRHLGKSAQSGHYIADVRSRPPPPATDTTAAAKKDSKATWARFDDAIVSKLQEGDSILTSASSLSSGYLFFYVAKEEPQAPSILPMQVCVTTEAETGVPAQ